MRLPKPCSTMKAGRRSPAPTPSGTRTMPASVRPLDLKVTRCSDIGLHRLQELVPRARLHHGLLHVPFALVDVHRRVDQDVEALARVDHHAAEVAAAVLDA